MHIQADQGLVKNDRTCLAPPIARQWNYKVAKIQISRHQTSLLRLLLTTTELTVKTFYFKFYDRHIHMKSVRWQDDKTVTSGSQKRVTWSILRRVTIWGNIYLCPKYSQGKELFKPWSYNWNLQVSLNTKAHCWEYWIFGLAGLPLINVSLYEQQSQMVQCKDISIQKTDMSRN